MTALPCRRGCFVTGTDTGVGKTAVSAALLHWCGLQGWRSAGLKPVAAGMEPLGGRWVNTDVLALQRASSLPLSEDDVGPCQLRAACAPHIAARLEGRSIALPPLLAAAQALARRADALGIEARGLRLAGWVANTVDPAMPWLQDNVATLRAWLGGRYGAAELGCVPRLDDAQPQRILPHLHHDALQRVFDA
jgi:dethiobiotin synthetase